MGTHELEVSFLAACLALPDQGRDYLAAIDESFLSTEGSRSAYRAALRRLSPQGAGKNDQGHGLVRDGDATDEGTVAAIVVRAAAESFTALVLKELFLRVQEQHVGRLIVKLKTAVARDDSDNEARLVELESTRRQIRDELRALPVED